MHNSPGPEALVHHQQQLRTSIVQVLRTMEVPQPAFSFTSLSKELRDAVFSKVPVLDAIKNLPLVNR